MSAAPEYDLLFRGGTVIDSGGSAVGDLAIRDGKIVARGVCAGSAKQTIDASGRYLVPGMIDAHVHFNEPGRTEWEGLATGSAALADGGGTCFIDMPLNSSPPVLDAATFRAKAEALQKNSRLDGAIWGGLVPGNAGNFKELAALGVAGFKAFMSNSGFDEFPRSDAVALREGMARAAELHLPVAVHAESEEMTARLSRERQDANKVSIRDYLDSRPIAAELEAIGVALEIARATGCALHIVHVSSAAGLGLIAEAKAKGTDVTAETCPHYLLFDEDDLFRLGAIAKCAPPLRPAAEREALWEALGRGLVDTIGSDHSPSPPDLKTGDNFFKIWGGIAGCQHAFPLMLEAALVEKRIDPSLLVRLASTNVAKRFRLAGKGDLQVGLDADVVVVEIADERKIASNDLLTRHKISPYVGRSTRLRVVSTWARGRQVGGTMAETSLAPARLLRPATL
jgi:allantoinase